MSSDCTSFAREPQLLLVARAARKREPPAHFVFAAERAHANAGRKLHRGEPGAHRGADFAQVGVVARAHRADHRLHAVAQRHALGRPRAELDGREVSNQHRNVLPHGHAPQPELHRRLRAAHAQARQLGRERGANLRGRHPERRHPRHVGAHVDAPPAAAATVDAGDSRHGTNGATDLPIGHAPELAERERRPLDREANHDPLSVGRELGRDAIRKRRALETRQHFHARLRAIGAGLEHRAHLAHARSRHAVDVIDPRHPGQDRLDRNDHRPLDARGGGPGPERHHSHLGRPARRPDATAGNQHGDHEQRQAAADPHGP